MLRTILDEDADIQSETLTINTQDPVFGYFWLNTEISILQFIPLPTLSNNFKFNNDSWKGLQGLMVRSEQGHMMSYEPPISGNDLKNPWQDPQPEGVLYSLS